MKLNVYYSTNTNRYLYKTYEQNIDPEFDILVRYVAGDCVVIKGTKYKCIMTGTKPLFDLDKSEMELSFIKA